MSKILQKLTYVVDLLSSIPTNNTHWDETLKAQIHYDIQKAIKELIQLKSNIEYSNYHPSDFLKLAKSHNILQYEFDGTTFEVSFDSLKLKYDSCEDYYVTFDGEYLKLHIYWSEEGLINDRALVYGIKVK